MKKFIALTALALVAAAAQAKDIVDTAVAAGNFKTLATALQAAGLRTVQVRTQAQLRGLHGLVLPGGESTTMLKLLDVDGLWGPLGDALRSGLPVFATCAGMILLAEKVENPSQRSYGLLPITVVRNGYGRQYHSGTFVLHGDALPPGTTGTFIRAPRVAAVGEGCEVLAWRDGDPALVQKGAILAAGFHPELRHGVHPVVARFAGMVREYAGVEGVG